MKSKKVLVSLLAATVAVGSYQGITGITYAKSSSVSKVSWFADINFWNPPQTWNTDPKTVQGVITKNTGLTFEMNIPPQDAVTKLNLMLASGAKLPDVMTLSDANEEAKLIKAGKVWNLQDFIKKYDPKSHLLKDFPNDIKKALTKRDGGWYAFPSHMISKDAKKIWKPSDQYFVDLEDYRNNNALMVNTKLMKQAGIKLDELKTENGLLAAYKKVASKNLKVNGAPVVPLLLDGKGYMYSTVSVLSNMFGGMEVDKNGKYRDMLFAPETKHTYQFLNKAFKDGYFDANQLTMDGTATKSLVLTGRVFTFIGNTANTGFSDQDNWTSPGAVQSSTGEKPVFGRNDKAGCGWLNTFISKSTKEPEKLAKWLSFMSSKEGLMLNYFGIKGKDYNLNKKGLAVQTKQGMEDATNYSKTGVFAYWPFHNIAFHDSAVPAPTDVKTGADGVIAMQVQTAFAKSKGTVIYDSSAVAFPGNLIPAGSKLDNIQIQVKQYREAEVSRVVLAKNDSTLNKEYNAMIAKLKELGQEKVDAEKNKYTQSENKDNGFALKSIN